MLEEIANRDPARQLAVLLLQPEGLHGRRLQHAGQAELEVVGVEAHHLRFRQIGGHYVRWREGCGPGRQHMPRVQNAVNSRVRGARLQKTSFDQSGLGQCVQFLS